MQLTAVPKSSTAAAVGPSFMQLGANTGLMGLFYTNFFFCKSLSLEAVSWFTSKFFSYFSKRYFFAIFQIFNNLNFHLCPRVYRGMRTGFSGKLLWKALSRKQKTEYHRGSCGQATYHLPATVAAYEYFSVTGVVNFKAASFI